jgi:hypothetical protein
LVAKRQAADGGEAQCWPLPHQHHHKTAYPKH